MVLKKKTKAKPPLVDGGTHLPLKRINAFIVELYQAAREVPAIRFKEWVFDRLQALLTFDSGIWINGTMEYGPQVHGMHLHRQPVEMMLNYEHIKHEDVLAQRIAEQPGVTWDLYSIVPREEWIKRTAYTEHCRKYGIEAAISTAILEPDTGLVTFCSLYRASSDHPFSETDRATKELLVPHLLEAYRTCLFLHLHLPAGIAKASTRAAALCDRMGVIHQSETGFSGLLRQEWPGWTGPLLPDAITRLINTTQNSLEGERVDIEVKPLDDIYQIHIWPHSPLHVLAPRERAVAELLSEGLPYKEIAQRLEISSSTVTNQANAIYRKLKISGRGELSRLVGVRGEDRSNEP